MSRLDDIELNVLALRNLADVLLGQIRAGKEPAPARSKKKTRDQRVAELEARVITGRFKSGKKSK